MGEKVGRNWERGNPISIYYVRRESIFNKRKNVLKRLNCLIIGTQANSWCGGLESHLQGRSPVRTHGSSVFCFSTAHSSEGQRAKVPGNPQGKKAYGIESGLPRDGVSTL